MRRLFSLLIAGILVSGAIVFSRAGSDKVTQSKAETWKKIKHLFTPPAEFKDQYGTYPSPLKFYDGRPVKNKKDWPLRRKEILDTWHAMMGQWPPLIKGQSLKILDSTRRENFTQYRISFKWTPDEVTEGYLLVPDGEGKKPAVITVYYEPETAIGEGKLPFRDFASQLAKRGFVTLSIGTTKGTNDKTWSMYYPDIQHATIEPLSMLAYTAANAWEALSLQPQVDSSRIGIMGHSYGGKWALFASSLYDKFACSVWSDPGIVFDNKDDMANYWEPWYLGYHPQPWRTRGLITNDNPAKGLYPTLMEKGFDLTDLHALMAPRPFMVSGGSVDVANRWIALNHAIAVNRLLGYKNRVAMANRPDHSPNEESNEYVYSFLEYFLKYK
ncbi:MAG: prolyl oligopeptidase family serine peptidase [Chitinophagaceae bacterium]|nr:prolyl oligopeptidase family serine peptidase [Chitinophagaceae bacterium]